MAKAFRSRISGTSDHYNTYRLCMVGEHIGNDYMKHEKIVLHRCESRSFIENRSAFNLASGYWIRICSHPKWVGKNIDKSSLVKLKTNSIPVLCSRKNPELFRD